MEENQNKLQGEDEALPCWLSPDPAQEDEPVGLCPCLPPKAILFLQTTAHLTPTPGSCVYNQLLQATLSLLASREYFASTYVPLLLFLKMDLNQDASRKEDEMNIFTEESKKYSLGENAIIFDEMGEGQELSSVNYCR